MHGMHAVLYCAVLPPQDQLPTYRISVGASPAHNTSTVSWAARIAGTWCVGLWGRNCVCNVM